MKKNLVLFSMASFMALMVFIGVTIVNDAGNQYQDTLKQIQDINAAKTVVINNSSDYENTAEKYTEVEIEEDFYYGYQHQYINQDDIYFFSMNDDWGEQRLKELEQELYANTHGDEIKYVDKVIVYPTSYGDAAGSHAHSVETYRLPISFFNLFPEETIYYAPYIKSTINIFGVREETKIEDIATVLSHEYGHHYTQHHFNLKFNEDDEKTQYYNLRFSDDDLVITDRQNYEHYIDEHMWYLAEVAAEDYVYFMGSESTRNIETFYDSQQKDAIYHHNNYTLVIYENNKYVIQCRNGMPHENVNLSMPIEVIGLDDYFFSFVDGESPFIKIYEPIGTLNLQIDSDTRYDKCYFTWDQPYSSPDVIYTLIGYGEDNYVDIMVKTTTGDQEGFAYLGDYTATYDKHLKRYFYEKKISYDFDSGELTHFRVSITFPDGVVLLSDAVTLNNKKYEGAIEWMR